MRGQCVLLAEDDEDDYLIFREVLDENYKDSSLVRAKDGVELIKLLEKKGPEYFDMLFLDINMPKKNGFQCIDEIKLDLKYKTLPIIIFSTSSDIDSIRSMYYRHASLYICKPNDYNRFKVFLTKAFETDWKKNTTLPASQFVLADIIPAEGELNFN
jgi:CheY-like chemotaxis protein